VLEYDFYALCFHAVVYMCLTALLWLLRVMLTITYNCFQFSMFFISVLVSLTLCVWSVVLCIFLYVSCLFSVLFYCNFYGPYVWNKRWWWWWLIDGVCFWIIFVVPSVAVRRYSRTRVILSRLHCTMYTHNMGATLNIDSTSKWCHCHRVYTVFISVHWCSS